MGARRIAAILSAFLLMTGMGVVTAPPAVAVAPRLESITWAPVAVVFNTDAPGAATAVTATIRMTVDRTDTYVFDSAFAVDSKCEDVFGLTCPRYLIADQPPVPVGGTDVIKLTGSAPNVFLDGVLNRSGRPGTRSLRAWVIYRKGGGKNGLATAPLPAFSDVRATIAAPPVIERGGGLAVKGLVEQFDKSWVDVQQAVQLQFKPDGEAGFDDIGAPVTSDAEGAFTIRIPAVGDPGDWRVKTVLKAPPLPDKDVFSNVVHVGLKPAAPPTPGPAVIAFASATPDTINVSFTPPPPATGGAVTEYRWHWAPGDGNQTVPAGRQTNPFPIDGLKAGTEYTITVEAVNAAGPGETAKLVAKTTSTPPKAGVPGPPKAAGTAGSRSATVTWKPADENGLDIDKYQVHRYRQDKTVGGGERSVEFKGLDNGKTYTFYVRAHNKEGWSGWSNAVLLKPRG